MTSCARAGSAANEMLWRSWGADMTGSAAVTALRTCPPELATGGAAVPVRLRSYGKAARRRRRRVTVPGAGSSLKYAGCVSYDNVAEREAGEGCIEVAEERCGGVGIECECQAL